MGATRCVLPQVKPEDSIQLTKDNREVGRAACLLPAVARRQ
jgi:hypothetical protein